MVPETAVGIIMRSEVPLAMRSLVPKSSMSAGTTTMPPPTPMRPATVPVKTPRTTSPAIVRNVSGSAGVARGDDEEQAHDHGHEEADEAPAQHGQRHRGSSHVPICAPTTAPAARMSPGIQATESLSAYEMTPTVAVGTIAASEVPAASR